MWQRVDLLRNRSETTLGRYNYWKSQQDLNEYQSCELRVQTHKKDFPGHGLSLVKQS